jgi:prolipoprotein diacylglyceryltransferase
MLYFGLVAGVVAGNAAAHASRIDAFRVFVATHILIVPALAGARLFYVATHWPVYRHDLRRIWNRGEGGFAQYGGLIVMLPLSVPVLAALQLPFGAFWDVAAFTILVGMIITRIGCLMNGCCAGRPSRMWGSVYLPNHLGVWERRIPTQCLEAVWRRCSWPPQ